MVNDIGKISVNYAFVLPGFFCRDFDDEHDELLRPIPTNELLFLDTKLEINYYRKYGFRRIGVSR